MKLTKFATSLCVSAILLTLVACSGHRPKANREEVMTAYASLLQAFQKKDMNALDHMFTAGATVVAPPLGGRVMVWSDARPMVEQSLQTSGDLQISRGDNGIVGVDRDMGWVADAYHVREAAPKGPSESDGIMTVVFQKTDRGYMILAFHAGRPPGGPVSAPSAPATPAKK